MRSRTRDSISEPLEISGLLGSLIPNRAWARNLARAPVWIRWEEIVGEVIAQQTCPWYLDREDSLVVAVGDSIWMQQLTYQKEEILNRINRVLPKNASVKNLSFRIADPDEIKQLLGGRRSFINCGGSRGG